jgi:hypothetical protein
MSHVSKLPFCRHACFQLLCNLHENGDGVLIVVEGFFIRLRQDQDHMAKKTGETCVYQIEVLWVLYLHAYTTHTHILTHESHLAEDSCVLSAHGIEEDWVRTLSRRGHRKYQGVGHLPRQFALERANGKVVHI